ncbi:type VII secretion protein EccB [Occultella kanbiaonis]|uniref:type VII secretion protein EccB n=1 Tax=Occultella kanbiaonis TaxID=2675754 RepID=UPI0012B93A51|nr:type VII secretion protein EccB [Occultella kanbiaonis]
MATKKELIAAQNFSRRRLLTAFVSGAPGGRELEPAKPLVGVVAGAVLSVLVVVGSLIAGFFTGSLPDGWEDSSLVVVDTGARYVARGGTLYPVANITSAQLLATGEDGELLVVQASEDDLAGLPRSSVMVGIEGAPDALPTPDSLINVGWWACALDVERTWVDLDSAHAGVEDPRGALVVVDGAYYYISGGYRYLVAEQDLTALSLFLGFSATGAYEVSARWLNLFTEGTPIERLSVPGAGDPLPGPAAEIGGELEVGSVVRLRSASGDTGAVHVFTADGALVELSAVALELYYMGTGLTPDDVVTLDNSEVQQVPIEDSAGLVPVDWPTQPLPAVEGELQPCAQLVAEDDPAAAGAPSSVALVAAPPPEDGDGEVSVAPGAGALVQLDGGGTQGGYALIDERGRMYPIPVTSTDVILLLGYGEVEIPRVSQFWAALFPAGPTLTVEAASEGMSAAGPS